MNTKQKQSKTAAPQIPEHDVSYASPTKADMENINAFAELQTAENKVAKLRAELKLETAAAAPEAPLETETDMFYARLRSAIDNEERQSRDRSLDDLGGNTPEQIAAILHNDAVTRRSKAAAKPAHTPEVDFTGLPLDNPFDAAQWPTPQDHIRDLHDAATRFEDRAKRAEAQRDELLAALKRVYHNPSDSDLWWNEVCAAIAAAEGSNQ